MSGRTDGERERARLERERRRAQREGRPLPEQEPAADVEPRPMASVDERSHVAREPVAQEPDVPGGWAPPPTADPVWSEPPGDGAPPAGAQAASHDWWAEAEPAEEQPAPPPPLTPAARAPEPQPTEAFDALDDDRDGPVRAVDPPSPPPWRAAEQPPGPQPSRRTVKLPRSAYVHDEDEAPSGVKAVGGYEPQPGAPGLPPNREISVARRRRRGVKRLTLLVALLLVAGLGYAAFRLFQPFPGDAGREVDVTIPEGATASDIADILADRGVIDSAFLFGLRLRIDGGQGLRSGPHELREDMTYAAALEALRETPQSAPTFDVTLPEGPSIRENARRVRQAGVRGSYRAAARRGRALTRARRLGLPRGTRTLEGFLFPSTFELRRGATARQLVARQLSAFSRATRGLDLRAARRAGLSRYEVLVIASMVEREALVPRERAVIAGVIYNRLREGIPLGIDATIRYERNNWARPLRVSELERDTPYNTRLRQGLPPTPIGNPGAEALRAAAAPRRHDFLFYVVKPCGNGAHAFSETGAQFQRDVAAYNRARDQRGGRDPSRC